METSKEAQPVTHADSESLVAAVVRNVPDRNAGIFGPGSISWKINRESALFLGAGRAALLQLAHPWVATALEQHSTVMDKPIKRFHNTFRIVFTMIFGSLDQAIAAARHLYGVHTYIKGELTEDLPGHARGSHYEANEIAALRWVYATLVESAVLAYECVLPPLGAEERAAYYAESKTMAALFGLPAEALPHDWTAFQAYCRAMEQSNELGVTTRARAMAQGLLRGAGSWLHPPRWYRALTTHWLPERLRIDFGLDSTAADARALDTAQQRLRRFYPRLPTTLRFIGPWHEAQARLANRSRSATARISNRFWIGQARLPF